MMHRGKVFWFEYRSQYAMENYHIALGSLANRTYGLTMPDPAGGIKKNLWTNNARSSRRNQMFGRSDGTI